MKESKAPSDSKWLVCERLRKLGYRSASTIRLYGEELHLISDPEPHESGFAVHGIAVKSSIVKRVHIPLSVVTMIEREIAAREKAALVA